MSTSVFSKFEVALHLTPSALIKETIKKIHNIVDDCFPDSKNFIVDTTWIEPHREELLIEYANIGHIDNLFLCATIDMLHIGDDFPLPKNPNLKIYQIGSINDKKFEQYSFNFAAISVYYLFKNYTENDLLIDNNPKRFLCYQNKPHVHRQLFTYKIIKSRLLNKGILTLQKFKDKDFLYPNLQIFSVDEEVDNQYRFDPTNNTNDKIECNKEIPYCLGDIKLWKQAFLIVTAETFHNNTSEPGYNQWFISEKTFKPIIGMRPFVLNGNPRILDYLADEGFYTFEEYWKDIDFQGQTTMDGTVNCCFQVVQRLCDMSNNEIIDMYRDMIPKLQHNRSRFFQYAQEQENKIYTLFK